MLESRYEATIAKPTASDSGTNSARPAPCMKNEGMNTARTQSIARSRGTAVCWFPRRTDRATERVPSIWWWMFSTSTVDSSTRMPIASASPPRVMMLIVCPVSQSPTSAPQRAIGMFRTTTTTLRQSRRNRRTIRPVRAAPSAPSVTTVRIDRVTVGDWSSSKLTSISSGRTACMPGMAFLTFSTTDRVEASARFVTRR